MLSAGCISYFSERNAPLEFDKIYVAPIKNDSFAPQAQELLTKQIRKKLATHPGLEVVSSPENAGILEITIVDFGQSTATTSDNDTIRAKSFDVRMAVVCTLSNSETGKVYFTDFSIVEAVECHVLNNDFQASQYQAIPKLTSKLADRIYDFIYNLW
jgi:hypothetical protein